MSNDLEVIRVTTSKDGDEVVDADFVMEGCPFVCTYINSGFSNKKVVNKHPDLQKSGAYILWSTGSRTKAYVGQATNLGSRFLTHYSRPDTESYCYDWDLHLSITRLDTDYGFSKDEIASLENRLNSLITRQTDVTSLNTGGTSEGVSIKTDSETSRLIDQAIEFIKLVIEKHFGGWLGKSVYTPNQSQNVTTKSKYTNFRFYSDETDDIVTPEWMVKQMVDLIPYEKFNPNSKFLDLAAKGGEFLKEVRNRLEEAPSMKEAFPARKERIAYIEENMLYGVCITKAGYDACLNNLEITEESTKHILKGLTDSDFVGRYGIANYIDAVKGIQITVVEGGKAHYITIQQELSRKFSDNKELDMKFDVVIGNPPYNNDLYLDFVQAGYEVLKDDGVTVMITPAKGLNGKGGEKNEIFRSNIGPHTETICFYPCAQEIFDIRNLDGIAYYVVHKDKTFEKKRIINRSSRVKLFNNEADREIGGQLNNVAYNIFRKIDFSNTVKIDSIDIRHFGLASGDIGGKDGELNVMQGDALKGHYLRNRITKNVQDICKYKVVMLHMCGNGYYGLDGMTVGLNRMYINKPDDVQVYDYMPIHICNTEDECKYFISYFNTRLVRFIMMTSLIGQTANNYEFWRFVPDPGAFDHRFDDDELYRKYGITDDEIAIIESVIKERK